MIGYLRGSVRLVDEGEVILEVSGVGYQLHCSTKNRDQLVEGQEAELWVYTHVREDLLHLYGFLELVEKEMFLALLKVNGVGPKMALGILSGVDVNQLAVMIEAGDLKGLSCLPKVGKKKAEQIVLALKDKMTKGRTLTPVHVKENDEIVSALVHLGYRLGDASRVVKEMPRDIDLQEGVRRGLALLSEVR